MKFKFDTKKLKDKLLEEAYKSEVELNCPQCWLYCGNYSINDLKKLWQIFCYNCDKTINIDFNET